MGAGSVTVNPMNIVVMTNDGVEAERGPGPYPGVQCCGCFEILCGMKVLAILAIIGGVGQVVYALLAFTYLPATSKNGALIAYIILLTFVGMPGLMNVFLQGRWLKEDSLKNRMSLLLGYKILGATQLMVGLWQIVGAYLILGHTLQVYLLETYPEAYGFHNNVCTVSGRCSIGTTLSDQLKYNRPAEVGGIIFSTIIETLLIYYYFTAARRLVALWA